MVCGPTPAFLGLNQALSDVVLKIPAPIKDPPKLPFPVPVGSPVISIESIL
jgi:hypothetical protein